MQTVTYFAQKEDDVECIGPRNGSVKLLPNSTMEVTIEYRYTLVPGHRNTLKCKEGFRMAILKTKTRKFAILKPRKLQLLLIWFINFGIIEPPIYSLFCIATVH